MGYSEHETERIEYTFHAFCKTVLRNEAINTYRELQRKQKREVSLDYLLSEASFVPSIMDTYFEEYDEPTAFVIKGQTVLIASKQLANALLQLSEQRRTVLLMYFFLGFTDEKIGMEYGRSRSTVNYWKLAALKQLRKEMEREHEE